MRSLLLRLRADRADLTPGEVRTISLPALVDTGAIHLVLPAAAAVQLGLHASDQVAVRHADERTAVRPRVLAVELSIAGRTGVFSAILEPDRRHAVVGAIVLEDLDLVGDCSTQPLQPRDPRRVTAAIG